MALTKSEKEMLQDTHDSMLEIKTVLLGTNGDNGLAGDVRRNSKAILKLFKIVWIIVGVLICLGAIVGSTIGFSGLF